MKKYCILAITKEDGESFNSAWLMCDTTISDSEEELIEKIKEVVDRYLKNHSDNITVNYKHVKSHGKSFLRIENSAEPKWDYITIEYGECSETIETRTYPEGEVTIKKYTLEVEDKTKTIGFITEKDGKVYCNVLTIPDFSRYSSDPYNRRLLDGISDERIDYLTRSSLINEGRGNKKKLALLEFEYKDKPVNNMRNSMGCSESWYDPVYSITETFTKEEIEAMTEKEVVNLWKLAENIANGLY